MINSLPNISSLLVCLLLISPTFAGELTGKRVLYIDSYHAGYAWSDGITEGVTTTLKNTGAELKIHRMDTKRNKSEVFKRQAALDAKAVIEKFDPDVVIASDDNAAKYLIQPYFLNAKLPFVFCGINWDASAYGFPAQNVTGMLEVNDVDGLIYLLKTMSQGERVGFIGGDTLTNRKEVSFYRTIFGIDVIPYFAKDFKDFKKGYKELQNKADILIFYNFIAIEGWDHSESIAFLSEETKIPSGTFQEGPLPYVIVGYLKVPQEQGRWAADAAIRILNGSLPSSIKAINNTEAKLTINNALAHAARLKVPFSVDLIASELPE